MLYKNRKHFLIVIIILCSSLYIKWRIDSGWFKIQNVHAANIPNILGGWGGQDLPLDKDVAAELKPDLIISRRYFNEKMEFVDFYGVFYSMQERGRTFHTPMNCYPASGWDILESETIMIKKTALKKAIINKGLEKRILYYWFYAGGRSTSNQYINKLMTLYSALFNRRTDGGLVTVSCNLNMLEDVEKNFIPHIINYFSP
ncbi:MAG: EpsI family protein [Desulfobacterales bacterium]|nr:EpsI family protein [Desulfobacterales bacterium]